MIKQIPLFKVFMSPNVDENLLKVLHSGFVGEGEAVKEFELNIAKYLNNNKIGLVNSGTSALHLAYHLSLYGKQAKSYNVDSSLEIISSPMTCTATNTPIISNSAKIVWADCDPVTGNICPDSIRKKITSKTKAIVMIHWGGNPCLIDEINSIGREYGIKVIEDAAHAFGAEYKGKKIGEISDFTCFSFQAIKHLTSIDGGAILSTSEIDNERIKLLRWFGIDREPKNKESIDLRCEIDVPEAGYKFHMNNISAVIGNENLKHMPNVVAKHRENAIFYNKIFEDAGIKVAKEQDNVKSSYWLYTIHVSNRDELMQKLKENGIASSKVHARNDTHSMFKDFFDPNLKGVEEFNHSHICIPVGWWVDEEDRKFIAENVIKYAKK
jgi:perosamine synthetase